MGPSEGIVLLTDGVVERRGADILEGLEQLSQFVVRHAGTNVESLVDAIATEFCATPQDDCCIVVLRRA